MKNIKLLILFLLMFIFTGCFASGSESTLPQRIYEKNQILYDKIFKHYKKWKGVKHKYSGMNKKGIDCSAYVQNVYKNALKTNIPRTTKLQSKIGQEIQMPDLQIADLVFFKTGFNSRHVGVYIGGGKFIHASKKKGVTISRLDNPYYAEHFWKIQRIIK